MRAKNGHGGGRPCGPRMKGERIGEEAVRCVRAMAVVPRLEKEYIYS